MVEPLDGLDGRGLQHEQLLHVAAELIDIDGWTMIIGADTAGACPNLQFPLGIAIHGDAQGAEQDFHRMEVVQHGVVIVEGSEGRNAHQIRRLVLALLLLDHLGQFYLSVYAAVHHLLLGLLVKPFRNIKLLDGPLRNMQLRIGYRIDIQLYKAGAARPTYTFQDVCRAVREVEAVDSKAAAVAQLKGGAETRIRTEEHQFRMLYLFKDGTANGAGDGL